MILGACAALSLAACTGGGSGSSTSTAAPTTSMTYYSSAPTSSAAASSGAGGSTSSSGAAAGDSSAAATASIAKPVMPAEAKAHTPAGAAAFARYYFEVMNYAWQKPAAGALLSMSLPSCKSCASIEAVAAEMVAEGYRFDRAPFEIASSDPGFTSDSGEQTVTVTGQQTAAREVSSSGTSTATAVKKVIRQVALRYDNGWKVAAIRTME